MGEHVSIHSCISRNTSEPIRNTLTSEKIKHSVYRVVLFRFSLRTVSLKLSHIVLSLRIYHNSGHERASSPQKNTSFMTYVGQPHQHLWSEYILYWCVKQETFCMRARQHPVIGKCLNEMIFNTFIVEVNTGILL